MKTQHTPGPWRWEINRKSKVLHLVGGKPMYDLTVMDFERWGMAGATARLRDTSVDGMNILYRVHERENWVQDFPGRSHHAGWCAAVVHPDATLMAASPDLLKATRNLLDAVLTQCEYEPNSVTAMYVKEAQWAIAKATGGAA